MTTQTAAERFRAIVAAYGHDPADWPHAVSGEVYADEELRELAVRDELHSLNHPTPMTKRYVRESNPAPRRAPRDPRAPEPRDGAHASEPNRKAPSFLATVKAELAGLLEEKEFAAPNEGTLAADTLWPLIAKKLAASYWNGVAAGSSGRVKPKERRAAATGEPAPMTYVVSGTWQPNAPRGGAHAGGDEPPRR